MTATSDRQPRAGLAGWLVGLFLLIGSLLGPFAAGASAAPEWAAYPVPRTSPFPVPLGAPMDLSCWSANDCLMVSGGNSSYPNGVFAFTGDTTSGVSGWKQYATVCGPNNDGGVPYARIAWAGPNEFWLVTTPSDPYDDASGAGRGLCHFSGGQVVGSYSTQRASTDTSADPYRVMSSAACRNPDECWFGGVAATRPDGTSPGTFHLHWDGSKLSTVYAPAKRGASDIAEFDGTLVESLFAGPDYQHVEDPALLDVPPYAPIQRIAAGASDESGFTDGDLAPSVPGFPVTSTEVLALDSGLPGSPGPMLWAVGGGAASGPDRDPDIDPDLFDDTPADTGPFVAYRLAGSGQSWHQIDIPVTQETMNDRFVDVAAIPGTHKAIAAVLPNNSAESAPQPSRIAKLDADTGTVVTEKIGDLGSVLRVECVSAELCWAATAQGWLLRYSDSASSIPQNTDPAMTATVVSRPNEIQEQALSDTAVDDSQLFAPAPVTDSAAPAPPKRLKAAVRKVTTKLKGTRLIFSFRTIRNVRVTITARRHGRVVARSSSGLLRPGRHRMVLRLNAKHWPTKIGMKVTEPKSASTSATLACAVGAGCR